MNEASFVSGPLFFHLFVIYKYMWISDRIIALLHVTR